MAHVCVWANAEFAPMVRTTMAKTSKTLFINASYSLFVLWSIHTEPERANVPHALVQGLRNGTTPLTFLRGGIRTGVMVPDYPVRLAACRSRGAAMFCRCLSILFRSCTCTCSTHEENVSRLAIVLAVLVIYHVWMGSATPPVDVQEHPVTRLFGRMSITGIFQTRKTGCRSSMPV